MVLNTININYRNQNPKNRKKDVGMVSDTRKVEISKEDEGGKVKCKCRTRVTAL